VTYERALSDVVDEVVAPGAVEVDRSGSFPRSQIDALGAAGLLALTVPQELGDGGQAMRAAALVVRDLGAACGRGGRQLRLVWPPA
jgi:alkylation response protein AidB-like acyl-CoA dehydrogenase